MNVILKNSALNAEKKDSRKLSMRAVREAQNDIDITLANVKSHRDGLTIRDATERLIKDGANEVAHDRRPHALVQFMSAFQR